MKQARRYASPVGRALAGLAGTLLSLWLISCAEPAPWNVLVVTLDTTRADHLGCYGKQNARTPNMDRLAEEGYLFSHHFSAVPITTPSHATIFTGTYPTYHGVRDNGLFSLPEASRTLAEILQARGYATGAAIGAFPLTREYGLDQGFDFYEDHISISRENYAGQLTQENAGIFFDERSATQVNDAILPWLRGVSQRPFFAWIHYWDAHHPHISPVPFSQLYDYDPYQGEIAYVDHSLGAILRELKKAGVYERTLIVITADHGEGQGEHEEDTHSLLAYDATLRVPLILRVPGLRGGTRVEQRAGTVDILPTILDLLGVQPPEAVQGRSLKPLMQPGGSDTQRRGLYYAETLSPRLSHGWGELRALYDGPYKLIHGPRPELYNLQQDPTEVRDLFAAQPAVAERMLEGLEGYLGRIAGAAAADAVHEASAESLQRLAALGYISSTGDSPKEISEQLRSGGIAPQDRVQDNSLSSQVKVLMTQGKYLAAKERALGLIDRDPGNAFYRSLLAMAYLGLDKAEEAAVLVEETDTLASRNDPIFLEVARRLFAAGAEARGLAVLQKIQAEKESSMGQYLLGEMHAASGNLVAYRTALDRALELDPDNTRARSSLAIHWAGQGRLAKAEAELLILVQKQPLNPKFQHNYGAILLNTERGEEAMAYFHRALELSPSYWRAFLSLLSAELSTGRQEEADNTYERLRDLCQIEGVLRQASDLMEAAQ